MIALPLFLAAAHPSPGAVDRSPAAAREVVRRYYAAIERGDFRAAWLAWDRGGGASGQSLASFTRGFAGTAHSRVVAGIPPNGEGAAGSVFITVPAWVEALLKDGRRQRFAGSYVLRRVNDVPGATRDQLGWHIASASLKPLR